MIFICSSCFHSFPFLSHFANVNFRLLQRPYIIKLFFIALSFYHRHRLSYVHNDCVTLEVENCKELLERKMGEEKLSSFINAVKREGSVCTCNEIKKLEFHL